MVAVPGRDASEVKMFHQEDMGVQREMAKMVFRRGIWSFVQKMDMHLRRYANQCPHLDEAVNAVSLAHKVQSLSILTPLFFDPFVNFLG
jgi:hypothetical protein